MDQNQRRLEYYHLVRVAQESSGDDPVRQREDVQRAHAAGQELGFTGIQVGEHIGDIKLCLQDLDEHNIDAIIEQFMKTSTKD